MADGKVVIAVKEKLGDFKDNELQCTVHKDQNPGKKEKAKKVKPIEVQGNGKYKVSMTTNVGTGINSPKEDQDELWATSDGGWALSDSYQFVDPHNDDFTIDALSATIGNNEQEEMTWEIVPIRQDWDIERTAEFRRLIAEGITQDFPKWAEAKGPDEAVKITLALLRDAARIPHETLMEQALEQAPRYLADQLIEMLVLCSQCTKLFTTPRTIYYGNTTWYNNCRFNPPCTPG